MELKLDRNKTYGLALEGGGAKGAYQIGAWKALREAGIRFSAVSGTSVGALNGAMIVMDDLEKAENVWNNIHFSQVMDVDDEEMRRLMNRDIPLSELKSTLRSVADIVRNRGFDVTPLRNWVAEVVDADKICHSDTDFFIVTYSLSDHQELELKASDLDEDELCDMLLASAYLPAFRLEKLGGKYYADGGVQDVVPIHALVENGCKDIIALRIFGFGIEKRFRIPDDVHVTTIGPTVDLGNILNFDAEQSRKNMRLGYFDAQRVLYGLYGSTYYIDRTMSEDAARQQLLEYLGTDDGSLRTFHEKTLPQIAKALKCDGDYYDLLIAVLEHDAKELGIASERIMTDMELLQAILSQPEPPAPAESEQPAPAAEEPPAPVQEHPADPVLTKPRSVAQQGTNPFPYWGQIVQKLEGIDPMLYMYLRKSKAYFDGTRVLIDGGKTFRDFIRVNKDSQKLIKKLIAEVSGVPVPIGPYEPKTAGKTASNAEQSLLALEKLGLEVSIEDTARKKR
jgi:NTE family protein